MSETWYQTTDYGDNITEVTAERSTDKYLYVKGYSFRKDELNRQIKSSTWVDHWPTFALAKEHLVSRNKVRLERALADLERARQSLAKVEAL